MQRYFSVAMSAPQRALFTYCSTYRHNMGSRMSLPSGFAVPGSGRALSPTAYHMGLSPNTAQGSSSLLAMHDSYAVGAASMPPAFGSREWQNQKEWQTQNDWQNQNQYQQLVNQHALLNQLQSKMQASQVEALLFSP